MGTRSSIIAARASGDSAGTRPKARLKARGTWSRLVMMSLCSETVAPTKTPVDSAGSARRP